MAVVVRVLTIQEFLLAYADGDPTEIERHSDRTMTVLSRRGTESITRCRSCPKESAGTSPCKALRVMALPYASHPAYRPEWGIAPLEAQSESAGESRPARRDVVVQMARRSSASGEDDPGSAL